MNNFSKIFVKILITLGVIGAMLSGIQAFVELYIGKGVIYRQGFFTNALVFVAVSVLIFGGALIIKTLWFKNFGLKK